MLFAVFFDKFYCWAWPILVLQFSRFQPFLDEYIEQNLLEYSLLGAEHIVPLAFMELNISQCTNKCLAMYILAKVSLLICFIADYSSEEAN